MFIVKQILLNYHESELIDLGRLNVILRNTFFSWCRSGLSGPACNRSLEPLLRVLYIDSNLDLHKSTYNVVT